MRFLRAYLLASFCATAVVLLLSVLGALASGLGLDALHDFWSMALIYALYSLAFTLGLGLVGWLVLRVAGLHSYLAYGLTGLTLPLLTQWLLSVVGQRSDDARLLIDSGTSHFYDDPFTFLFAAAGIAAALSFRWLYYRQPAGRPLHAV